ncbi:MAG: SAM-dependent methyltransferase, partial [Pseudorhodoplanes sp.]
PPAGVKSPAMWGTRARLQELFGKDVSEIVAEPRIFNFRYRSPQHFLEIFRTYYGPMLKAFEALDDAGRTALARDVVALVEQSNASTDGTMVVPSQYLEAVIIKR